MVLIVNAVKAKSSFAASQNLHRRFDAGNERNSLATFLSTGVRGKEEGKMQRLTTSATPALGHCPWGQSNAGF